jgi:hypothetical protein
MTRSDSFHPCSCAGLNENCYRCGGTGIAGVTPGKPGPPLTEGRSQHSTVDQKSGRSASKIDSTYCSKCKVSFNRLYWKKHKKKHQQLADSLLRQPPYAPRGRALIGDPSPRGPSRWKSGTDATLRQHPKPDNGHFPQRDRVLPSALDERLAAIQNDRKERLLDHSKDIGFPCRESGRYGSYPSHDGFDDESKP